MEGAKLFFGGTDYHSLDEKGRLTLPGPTRAVIQLSCSPELYLSYLPGTSFLSLYTYEKWVKVLAEWNQEERFRSTLDFMDFKRVFFSKIATLTPDKAGRILLPATHREWIKLEKEAVVAGCGDKIEIWERGAFVAYEKKRAEAAASDPQSFLNLAREEERGVPRFPSW
ncbi:MAG: hypothetical protein LBO66_07510 [Deltaproteobacteria bacterium]|jgi:MraZ protein|nr:hypothetical protein [Deltaproteobacteria bacterium]